MRATTRAFPLRALLPCAAALALACPAAAQEVTTARPDAGQQHRQISSLSPEEVQAYLAGEGMGLARPAELNHYPGPRHVLDLGSRLDLTDEQRDAVQAVLEEMRAEAVILGARIIAAESALDAWFASGSVREAELQSVVAAIAELQGRLRTTHLRAHLRVRELLTPEQVANYDRLRGYGDQPAGEHGGHSPASGNEHHR